MEPLKEYRIMVQSTPNPNALKFVLNTLVKSEGKVMYKSAEECHTNPLARVLFSIPNVVEVYFFDNYITVTQDGNGDWDKMEEEIRQKITDNIKNHDPNFKIEEAKKPVSIPMTPEVVKIEQILDDTIRPALQMDGGDIQIINFENNIVYVNYQGACGSCPSSTMGTLKAIENILKDQFNPEVEVQLAYPS